MTRLQSSGIGSFLRVALFNDTTVIFFVILIYIIT